MVLPFVAIVLGMLFFLGESIVNYAFGGVLLASGIELSLCLFLFVPHSYIINKDGIKTFYRIKSCNYIPWSDINGIHTSFDIFYENLFFWKNYVISHKNMKRNGRAINTVTKTKKTKTLIEKYWWRGVDSISL